MLAWWQMWPGYFDADWCARVISEALVLPIAPAKLRNGKVDNEVRISQLRWIKFGEPLWDLLIHDIDRFCKISNNNAFGFELNLIRDIQFTEYRAEDDGHYKMHEDIEWKTRSHHRKVSLVIQLSDPEKYSGGTLEFERESPPRDLLRRQGTVICFPSFSPHQVTAVTNGIRHSLVAWCEGPKFR